MCAEQTGLGARGSVLRRQASSCRDKLGVSLGQNPNRSIRTTCSRGFLRDLIRHEAIHPAAKNSQTRDRTALRANRPSQASGAVKRTWRRRSCGRIGVPGIRQNHVEGGSQLCLERVFRFGFAARQVHGGHLTPGNPLMFSRSPIVEVSPSP
jgi:hypothetical protein